MSDYAELVARLRMRSATQPENFGLDDEAADAIEELRAKLAQVRRAADYWRLEHLACTADLAELREQLQVADHTRAGLEADLERWKNNEANQMQRAIDAEAELARVTEQSSELRRLTNAQIASVCLSYRHDFGLLTDHQQSGLMFEAREWERAFRKEHNAALAAQPPAQPLTDEQIDEACKTVPAAIYTLMHNEVSVEQFRNALRQVARAILAAAREPKP
jgi:chromosome segregation ATPase